MEQELAKLTAQFDQELAKIKQSVQYQNYVSAKQLLDNNNEAKQYLVKIKELQKIRVNTNDTTIINELTQHLNRLETQYQELFVVSQFNLAYENLVELVHDLKLAVEACLK